MQYSEPSSDPIFPGQDRSDEVCSGVDLPCWVNMSPRPTVLGCVELAQVCTPSGSECFDPWSKDQANQTSWSNWATAEEAFLIWCGIMQSSFGNTLSTRGSYLLDATRRVVIDHMSLPLDKEQWKIEVRRLFDMAILRVKAEMLYVVQGTQSSEPGFVKLMTDKVTGACTKYKFQAKGYKNISVAGIMVVGLAPLLLGIEVGASPKRKPLIAWIVVGVWKLVKLFYCILRWTTNEIASCFRKFASVPAINHLPGRLRRFMARIFRVVQPISQPATHRPLRRSGGSEHRPTDAFESMSGESGGFSMCDEISVERIQVGDQHPYSSL
jgi:hypothetical protein